MANLKEIRGRIASISSTMQITSAMKMVSAAKLKKAQDAIVMLRPYSQKLQELIEQVSAHLDDDSGSKLSKMRPVTRILFVAITSNRGLAGAFNSSIIKEVENQKHRRPGVEVEVLAIGKKGYDHLRNKEKIYGNHSNLYDVMSFEAVAKIAEGLMKDFENEGFDEIYLVYNKFVNAATQEVTTERFLPIAMPEQKEEAPKKIELDYIFEPDQQTILETLIPKSIKTQLYKSILDSIAAEHGARMTAMHKATDNAQSLKNDLVIYYNKARQAAITNEILEIVSGAEALSKG